jgi:hypothetical protein
MRSPWVVLAPLAPVLLFTGPAKAVDFLPPCCVVRNQTRPDDPHHGDTRDFESEPRHLETVTVERPQERALEAAAEAQIPVDAPLANAIGIPMEPRGTGVPEREPERAGLGEGQLSRSDIEGPPCCQTVGETYPPDPGETDDPAPFFIAAEIRGAYDRVLQAAVEAPIPAQPPRVDAIRVPLARGLGVSEPAHTPADATAAGSWLRVAEDNLVGIAALGGCLLATFLWVVRRRPRAPRSVESFADQVAQCPAREEEPRPGPALVAMFALDTPRSSKTAPQRELEPA